MDIYAGQRVIFLQVGEVWRSYILGAELGKVIGEFRGLPQGVKLEEVQKFLEERAHHYGLVATPIPGAPYGFTIREMTVEESLDAAKALLEARGFEYELIHKAAKYRGLEFKCILKAWCPMHGSADGWGATWLEAAKNALGRNPVLPDSEEKEAAA